MVWYKRSKLVFDMCRNMASAIGSNHLAKSPSRLSRNFSGQSIAKTTSFSAWSRFGHQSPFKLPPNIATVRSYSSSSSNRDRYTKGCFIIAALGTAGITGAAGIAICTLEEIPYSDRSHLVLMPRLLECKLGEFQASNIKNKFKEDALPANHPLSTRVRAITKNMIEARLPPIDLLWYLLGRHSLAELFPEYHNWEVTVIDRPSIAKAYCYAGGKVVIFTGLLNHLKSDAEIATVIGHEIGHDVARHAEERITKLPLLACLRPFKWLFCNLWGITYNDPKLIFFEKQETEADNIGLRLMACGGYDPSNAPNVYKRLSRLRVANDSCCSSLSNGSKRADLLSQSKLMEEAKSLYRGANRVVWAIESFINDLLIIHCFPVLTGLIMMKCVYSILPLMIAASILEIAFILSLL